jgi:hypothetical protein
MNWHPALHRVHLNEALTNDDFHIEAATHE